ncbi:MAG: leucine-rich repeat domain-containing protein, partial [Saprospiraceae bacterium]|nr:leucine-rich repeat domain-containing protein [Saprospiraceae bacterium]
KNLRFLGIGMRGFKTIPAGISQLKYLEEIDFQHGSIETLPDDFCQLRNLRNAIFLFSNLKELPECIGDLENLEYLHLGHTYITRFPESMKNLKKLKIVLIQQSPDKPHISESEYLKLKSWLPKCGIHYELRNVD